MLRHIFIFSLYRNQSYFYNIQKQMIILGVHIRQFVLKFAILYFSIWNILNKKYIYH